MDQPIIQIEQLDFAYEREEGGERIPALSGVDLSIFEGSFVAVIGQNGSGKSTLAKCLNALLLPGGGAVYVKGMDTKDDASVWEIRKTVGMVFQNPDNQLVSSIVEDDVAFGPENLGVEPSQIRRRVDEALQSVDMYEHRKKGPHLLSGGQKQRVAIAGVLAMESECIVLDEPTAMLDPSGRKEVMEIIHRLHQQGKTIILITHFMEEAAQADRVVIMEKGHVVFDGTPKEVFTAASKLESQHLDMPFAVQMAARLRKRGMNIPHDVITDQGLVEHLCASK
ncbi:MAG: energy-coupling factor transporter ATPase [Eubacteriales bacterium]|jgi:energy-coupling factor transport system ATP-binding protein|nr:energy-coupling factor transporter ATPase [Eubacteriales bacterium]